MRGLPDALSVCLTDYVRQRSDRRTAHQGSANPDAASSSGKATLYGPRQWKGIELANHQLADTELIRQYLATNSAVLLPNNFRRDDTISSYAGARQVGISPLPLLLHQPLHLF